MAQLWPQISGVEIQWAFKAADDDGSGGPPGLRGAERSAEKQG